MFVAASDAGEINGDINLFAARMLAFGAMNWTADWFGHQQVVDAATIADTAVAVLLGGLSNSSGRPGASATERTATAQR